MLSGIYRIRNERNSKVYIGQSRHVRNRLNAHKALLRAGKHKNAHLQAAFQKYGEDAFTWERIESVCLEELNRQEAYWIAHYDSCNKDYGYNIVQVDLAGKIIAGPNAGKKASEETKRRMSLTRTGKTFSEAHRAAITQANCTKLWHFIHRETGEVILEHNLQAISRNRGLNVSALHRVTTGKLNHHKGWILPPTATATGNN